MSDKQYTLEELVFKISQMNEYRSFKNDGSRQASFNESQAIDRAISQAGNEGESVIRALLSAAASAHEAAETAYLAFECLRDTAENYLNARNNEPAFATDSKIISIAESMESDFYDFSRSITEHHKEAQSACDYAWHAYQDAVQGDENDEDDEDAKNEETKYTLHYTNLGEAAKPEDLIPFIEAFRDAADIDPRVTNYDFDEIEDNEQVLVAYRIMVTGTVSAEDFTTEVFEMKHGKW